MECGDIFEWLDGYRGKCFDGDVPTILQIFLINSRRFPGRKCFECFNPEHISLDYSQVASYVRRIGLKLARLGFGRGDKIAVCGKNSPEWAVAYLAVLAAGCMVVPLDTLLHENEVSNLALFADIKFAFIDSDKYGNFGSLGLAGLACLDGENDGFPYIFDMADGIDESFFAEPDAKPDDTAAILFTSGTTGMPKGVELSNRNFMADVFSANNMMRFTSNDVFYAVLPLHHAYTMLAGFIAAISMGAAVVFGKRLVASQMFSEIKKGGVTVVIGVPALFNKIISGMFSSLKKRRMYKVARMQMVFFGFLKKRFNWNLSKRAMNYVLRKISFDGVKVCICGGGPLSPSTYRYFNQLGLNFVQGYGMTETGPIISLSPFFGYDERSVGKILDGLEARIVDPDSDGNGVLYVRGPVVMNGYYKNPEATRQAITADGFINTGDVGHINSRNFLYLTGRAKNIIVTSGGKNVFPEEIEDEFQLFENIDQVMVAGYPLPDGSEGIKAIVHPSDLFVRSVERDRDSIEKMVKEVVVEVNRKLSSYKKIAKVQIADSPLEMTSTKKIRRAEVARRFDNDKFVS